MFIIYKLLLKKLLEINGINMYIQVSFKTTKIDL